MKRLILVLFCLLPIVVGAQNVQYNNFNFKTPKDPDYRTGKWNGTAWIPYATVQEACDSVRPEYRYQGLQVRIGAPNNWMHYHWYGGTANVNLVPKTYAPDSTIFATRAWANGAFVGSQRFTDSLAAVRAAGGDTTGKGLLTRSAAAATYARGDSLTAKEARLNTRIDNIPTGDTTGKGLETRDGAAGKYATKQNVIDTASTLRALANGKQPLLGFAPENPANKATSLASPNNVNYPTTQAVQNALNALPGGTTYAAGTNITFSGSNPTTINATGTLSDPRVDSLQRSILRTVNCTWYGSNIAARSDSAGGFYVTVPAAPFSTSGTTPFWFGDNYLDGWSGRIPNGNALILDPRGNGTFFVAPSDYDNVKSVTTRVPFIQVINNELYSAIPSVQVRLPYRPNATLANIFNLHTDWVYTTIQGRNPISSIAQATNGYTFTINDAYFVTGNLPEQTFNAVSSYTGTLGPGRALCFEFLDNGNVTIINVPNIVDSIRSRPRRTPFVFNAFGTLLSPSPVVTEYIKQALSFPVVIHKKVDVNGTVGVNCDYNTIVAAINDITDASVNKRYVLDVANGLYSTNQDIVPKDYIDVRGQSKEGVILVGARSPSSPGGVSTIYIVDRSANCTFSNLTIQGVEDQYAVHFDCPTGGSFLSPMRTVFQNCIIRQFENRHAIGIGIYNNQTLEIVDCEVFGRGIYAHNGGGNAYGNTPLSLKLINTRVNGTFTWSNFGTNQAGETLTFDNSTIGVLDLVAGSTTIPYTNFIFRNAKIGATTYDGNLLALLGGKHLQIDGHNRTVYNTSSSAIAKGYAVIEQPNTAATITYPSDETQTDRIAPYTGAGIFAGFAELPISGNAAGTIQISGTPQAYFNSAGGSVAYGDELELNASGQVQKRSTGAVVATAQDAASASGLITVRMLDGKIYRAGGSGGGGADSSVYQTNYQASQASTNDRARANHTGTQLANTISNFNTAAAAAAPIQSVAGRTGAVTIDTADLASFTSGINSLRGIVNGKANTSHTHTASQVTDFNTAAASAAPVQSVNSQTGAVVLTTSNIAEGTNQYFTNTRARSAISATGSGISYNATTGVLTGSGITSETDPVYAAAAPSIVTLTGSQALTNKSVNGVTLQASGATTQYLNAAGTYTTPAGGGGGGSTATGYETFNATKTDIQPLFATSGTTLQIIGGMLGSATTAGTAANSTAIQQNYSSNLTKYPAYTYTSTAANNSAAAVYSSVGGNLLRGASDSSDGGFMYSARFGVGLAPSGCVLNCGVFGGGLFLHTNATAASSWVNTAMLAKESGDATFSFVTRNSSGTSTKQATGITVNANSIYDIVISCPRGSNSITFTLTEYPSAGGKTTYSYAMSTTLPDVGAFLAPLVSMSTASQASQVRIFFYRLSIMSF